MARRETRKSFILRVVIGSSGYKYLVRDLKSGEWREFANLEELHRYLERLTLPRLR